MNRAWKEDAIWVSDDTNRVYIVTSENPTGELCVGKKEFDRWLSKLLNRVDKEARDEAYAEGLEKGRSECETFKDLNYDIKKLI